MSGVSRNFISKGLKSPLLRIFNKSPKSPINAGPRGATITSLIRLYSPLGFNFTPKIKLEKHKMLWYPLRMPQYLNANRLGILLGFACILFVTGCAKDRGQFALLPINDIPEETQDTATLWPVDHPARLVTSGFGMRGGFGGSGGRLHSGVDMTVPMDTPVVATHPGLVSFSGTMRGYGEIIVMEHDGGMQTAYAHLNKREAAVGDKVKRGQRIGLSGQSGNATAPHVHYEVRLNGVPVDPAPYLPK